MGLGRGQGGGLGGQLWLEEPRGLPFDQGEQ